MKEHDKIATRLGVILNKLNNGEKLTIQDLVNEFSVSVRTIQRDLNERLSYLPLVVNNKQYSLNPYFLGKLSSKDIKNFAIISGIRDLYPKLSTEFIGDLLNTTYTSVYAVKGHNYEEVKPQNDQFEKLAGAIKASQHITISYKGKYYQRLQPYKLINSKGIWYLAAVDNDTLKSFCVNKIIDLSVLDENFKTQRMIFDQIENEDSIWFGKEKIEVVVKVSADVSSYFKRRGLVPHQNIVKELDNGEMIVSSKVCSPTQIVPIIKYWIPHIRVISPDFIRNTVAKDIEEYLRE